MAVLRWYIDVISPIANLQWPKVKALAAGVFGVPTLQVDDALFWGNDAHAFALAALEDPALLADPEMRRVGRLPVAATRRA